MTTTRKGHAPLTLEEVRERLRDRSGPAFWRGLEELAGTAEFEEMLVNEFPAQASVWPEGVSRRGFLSLMGASLAFGGLTACTRQPLERIVQVHEVDRFACRTGRRAERQAVSSAASLPRAASSGMIDENLPHDVPRQPEELPPIRVAHDALIDEPDIRPVNQGRWLQRVPGPLAPHERHRQVPELLVHLRSKPCSCALIAGPRGLKQ